LFGDGGHAVGGQLWRDASGRLTCDSPGVAAADYPAVCRAVADAFGLAPLGEYVVGPDQMFWDFGRGGQVVGLDWDIWFEFMAVAKSAVSEPLIHEIAAWLGARQDAEPRAAADPARLSAPETTAATGGPGS
jgi:hypothetical protein